MPTRIQHSETMTEIALKGGPPASVSLAALWGIPISDLVLWATFLYTCLMIGHKLWTIYQDIRSGSVSLPKAERPKVPEKCPAE